MKVIECGENDQCNTTYRCPNCESMDVEEWMNYCPGCGRKIDEFLARCCTTKQKHDKGMASLSYHTGDYYVRCNLPVGHTSKHEGIDVITGRKNTWSDD